MRVTFLVPSTKRAIGGVTALYEFANGLRRRGNDVNLVHLPVVAGHIEHLDDLASFPFAPGIEHHVVASLDAFELPPADFIEVTGQKFFAGAWPAGKAESSFPDVAGLPFVFVQAYKYLPPEVEELGFRSPFPKISIAHWMVDALRADGVPDRQLAYVPYGLDHETYRLVRPIAGRARQITMLYNGHPVKGARDGLAVIEEVQRRVPGLRVVVFGNHDASAAMPPGVDYVDSPSRESLVTDIYNTSRVFLCSSLREGFGFCAIEAMAGGCAVVSTDNGGSDDYAINEETALVCAPRDVSGMADRIQRLLLDDGLSERIATSGNEFVRRFDWDDSARLLEEFLARYGTRPDAFR